MQVTICGIDYMIERVTVIDEGVEGIVQGQIHYSQGKILIKDGLPKQIEEEVLTHEIVHGILNHIGESELAENETFVQGLANGIYNSGLLLNLEEGK